MFRVLLALILGVLAASVARATDVPPLLQETVRSWLGEQNRWAFTQRAVEYTEAGVHERLERYDPSQPGDARWALLAIDGKPPTSEQRAQWAEKKYKHHHRSADTPIGDFLNYHAARVVAQTPTLVRYEVPLRRDRTWIVPVDKVSVRVTINKDTRALEHLTAHVREPFKVLLGIGRITGGDADLDFLRGDFGESEPGTAQPKGMARMSVSKMGERVDFTWSDFRRVTPYRGAGGPGAEEPETAHPGDEAATPSP